MIELVLFSSNVKCKTHKKKYRQTFLSLVTSPTRDNPDREIPKVFVQSYITIIAFFASVFGRLGKLFSSETKSLGNTTPLTEPPIYPISRSSFAASLVNKCTNAIWLSMAATRQVLFQRVRSHDHDPFLYARHLTHPHPQHRIRV